MNIEVKGDEKEPPKTKNLSQKVEEIDPNDRNSNDQGRGSPRIEVNDTKKDSFCRVGSRRMEGKKLRSSISQKIFQGVLL